MRRKAMGYVFFLSLCLFCMPITSCLKSREASAVISSKEIMAIHNDRHIVTAPIIFKGLVSKGGFETEDQEAYVQLPQQEYFIKFSESSISLEELQDYLVGTGRVTEELTLEIEYREGYWDISHWTLEDLPQSRRGEYVAIHEILECDPE